MDLVLDAQGAPALKDAAAVKVSPPKPPPAPSGPAKAQQQAQADDVLRRRDAVVDAARTLSDLTPDGVREFVTKRWQGRKVLQESDVESFATDARKQRLDDVIDALDHRVRSGVFGKTNAAHVKFPRGVIRQTLRDLSPDETALVTQRLRARGWSEQDLKRHLKTFKGEVGVQAEEPLPHRPPPPTPGAEKIGVALAPAEIEFEIRRGDDGRVSSVIRRSAC